MEKTIDNSFIEEREILIGVFSGYRRWNRVEKEEYDCFFKLAKVLVDGP